MDNLVRKSFKGLLIAITAVSATAFISFWEMAATLEFYGLAPWVFGISLCTIPFIMLGILITGIYLLIYPNSERKQKRGFENARLDQVSPQERAYLEQRLTDREVGLSDDGEIVSMNDLLDEFEQKTNQDW